jgi:hypothetical protein
MPLRIRHLALAAALLAAATLVGCSEGRKQPPKTTVSVVDAAPTQGQIDFLREQRVEATLDYRAASSVLVFDEDEYSFNVRTTRPWDSSPQLLDTFSQQVQHGTDYLFVITEQSGAVTHLVFEKPTFSSTSEAEVQVIHAAPSGPAFDVFVTAPDAELAGATAIGSVAFEEATSPLDLAPGDYALALTEAGNPANVLFTSAPFTVAGGASLAFVVVQEAGEGLSPYSVVIAGTSTGGLVDKNAPAGLEIVNAAADGAARDVYLDDDFGAPLAAAVPSPAVAMQVTVAPGTRKLSVTPAGNPGVVEAEQSYAAAAGQRETALIAGDPGSLTVAGAQDDPRPIVGETRVRFMNAATLFTAIEVYIVTHGTDVTTVSPLVGLTVPAISGRVAIPPGTYDLVLRDPTTSTIVAGPQSLTFEDGGVASILVTNGADPGTANVVLLQGFD